MAVSSANISGHAPAVKIHEARQQFGSAVSVYLDGGEAAIGEASTIIDISSGQPVILREGAISPERIGDVLGVDPDSLRRTPRQ